MLLDVLPLKIDTPAHAVVGDDSAIDPIPHRSDVHIEFFCDVRDFGVARDERRFRHILKSTQVAKESARISLAGKIFFQRSNPPRNDNCVKIERFGKSNEISYLGSNGF